MRIRPEYVVAAIGIVAALVLIALVQFTQLDRLTSVGISSIVLVVPLLLHSQLVLRSKRERSDALRREVLDSLMDEELGRKRGQ